MPDVCQISVDSLTQGSEPVTLATAANTRQPSIGRWFAGYARPDRLNRSLKALKVSLGPQTDDTTTIRTAIKFKQQRLFITIKNSIGKTMSPQSVAVAAWTVIWLLPWVISTEYKKFLENDRKKDYHKILLGEPVAGSRSFKGRFGALHLTALYPKKKPLKKG